MKDLKIITKCYVLVVLVVVVLMTQAILNSRFLSSIDDTVTYQQEQVMPIFEASYELRVNTIQIQQWLTDISATRGLDGLNDGFDEAEKHYVVASQVLDKLERFLPEKRSDIQTLRTALDNFYSEGKSMAQIYVAEGPNSGNRMMSSFDSAAEALQEASSEITSYTEQKKIQGNKQIEDAVFDAGFISNISFVLILLTMGVFLLFLRSWLIKPISELEHIFKDLNKGQASLGFRFTAISKDEFGVIKEEFNLFIEKLQGMASEIAHNVNDIQAEIATLDQSTISVGTQTQQIFSQLELLATAMTEMASTTEDVTKTMEHTSENVGEMEKLLDNVYQLSSQTESASIDVSEQIQQSTTVINELNSNTNEIVAMVDNIQSIAEQTNLLALNAAIEAARAGEQGRGFAVVADEVRALASRTQDSTAQINTIIQSLQSNSKTAVEKMTSCSEVVAQCVDYAQQGKQSIQTSRNVSSSLIEQVVTVASAMEQQSCVVSENTKNIVEINDSASTLDELIMQNVKNASEINNHSKELKQLAGIFDSSA